MAALAPRAEACRLVEMDFRPSDRLQVVIWIEDAQGTFVETVFMTDATGRYGLGNRPGRFDFNSEWRWPYGRRTTTFPVWAGRSPADYPLLVFQDGQDDDLSHPLDDSSPEPFYYRPLKEDEVIDAMTNPTPCFTDKGTFSRTERTKYPPRNDMTTYFEGVDDPDMLDFGNMNDLDAISQPTPPVGEDFVARALMPESLPDGDYVAWIEVSQEFDQNATYDYPSPPGIDYPLHGQPYRGQPSVVWKVPFTIDDLGGTYAALDYAGYGDPDGVSGDVRGPDSSITTGVDGTGAGRLLAGGTPPYRFRVSVTPGDDIEEPGPARDLHAEATSVSAIIDFTAPGDDGATGTATQYEIRTLAGMPLTEANFQTQGVLVPGTLVPAAAGSSQSFAITGLTPQTRYWVGIRASDDCLNQGALAIFEFTTPRPESPPVDSCICRVSTGGRSPVPWGWILGFALLVAARRKSQ